MLLLNIMIGCTNKDTSYYDNGALYYEVPLKNGKRHGTLIQYYENGKVQLESHWKNGLKDGDVISYHKNGEIYTRESYSNDKAHGTFFSYDSLGRLVEKVTYEHGKLNGKFIGYHASGDTAIVAYYRNDKRDGKAILLHEKGIVKEKRIYDQDSLVYSVSLAKEGGFFNATLPIEVSEKGSDSLCISLQHSFYEKPRIGVIFGRLDSADNLIDTIKVAGKIGRSLCYKLSPDIINEKNEVTGKLFEIDMSDNLIKGTDTFRYDLKSK